MRKERSSTKEDLPIRFDRATFNALLKDVEQQARNEEREKADLKVWEKTKKLNNLRSNKRYLQAEVYKLKDEIRRLKGDGGE